MYTGGLFLHFVTNTKVHRLFSLAVIAMCMSCYIVCMYCFFQIGWRKFSLRCYDLRQPKWMAVLNVLWPTLICLLIIASCVTQIIACFRRDSVSGTPIVISSFIFLLSE